MIDNPITYNIILYFFGLGGALIHWLKKSIELEKGQTWASLKRHFSSNVISTIVAFLSYNLMFFFILLYLADGGRMNALEVLFYGYGADSLSKMLEKKGPKIS